MFNRLIMYFFSQISAACRPFYQIQRLPHQQLKLEPTGAWHNEKQPINITGWLDVTQDEGWILGLVIRLKLNQQCRHLLSLPSSQILFWWMAPPREAWGQHHQQPAHKGRAKFSTRGNGKWSHKSASFNSFASKISMIIHTVNDDGGDFLY